MHKQLIYEKLLSGWLLMISYKPLYKTLLDKGLTEYHLIYKHGFSAHILHRMKHGNAITTKTLDTLCTILECDVCDILEYLRVETEMDE
jgi:DNA-binding Xre family transcriptional regulator